MSSRHAGIYGLCEEAHVCPTHEGTDVRCGEVFDDPFCGQVSCSHPEPTDEEGTS